MSKGPMKEVVHRIEIQREEIDFEIFRGVHGAIASIFGIEVEGTFNIVRLKFHTNRFICSKVMNNFLSKSDYTKGDQNRTNI